MAPFFLFYVIKMRYAYEDLKHVIVELQRELTLYFHCESTQWGATAALYPLDKYPAG
jgi:hypothetical protein